jgi:hypothetical protein
VFSGIPSFTMKIAMHPLPGPSLSIQICPSIRFTNLITNIQDLDIIVNFNGSRIEKVKPQYKMSNKSHFML